MGTWGAEVSSVQGVSADVVVFEVGLSVRAGGIATIGAPDQVDRMPGTAADTPHTQALPPSRPPPPLHAFPQTAPLRTAQPRPRPPM